MIGLVSARTQRACDSDVLLDVFDKFCCVQARTVQMASVPPTPAYSVRFPSFFPQGAPSLQDCVLVSTTAALMCALLLTINAASQAENMPCPNMR